MKAGICFELLSMSNKVFVYLYEEVQVIVYVRTRYLSTCMRICELLPMSEQDIWLLVWGGTSYCLCQNKVFVYLYEEVRLYQNKVFVYLYEEVQVIVYVRTRYLTTCMRICELLPISEQDIWLLVWGGTSYCLCQNKVFDYLYMRRCELLPVSTSPVSSFSFSQDPVLNLSISLHIHNS